MTSKSLRLLSLASLPPFSITQLPLFMQSADICTKASGLDSKITPITPIGQLVLTSVSPSSSSRTSSFLKSGSGMAIRSLMPFTQSASLWSSKVSLPSMGAGRPVPFALSVSLALNISSFLASSASAMAANAAFLTFSGSDAIL